jgi:hypothetical protein
MDARLRLLGCGGLLDSVALFQRSRLIVWRQRFEQNACSAGFQDRSSGSIHPSDHETCVITHLKRRLARESWLIAVQPISFMSRSISVCMRRSARSTPAWPAAAKG